MASLAIALQRRRRGIRRRADEIRMFAAAMASRAHPILAQVVPTRRCNLACRYCNEFDHVSQPVPLDEMLRRIDRLGALGTSIITLSGGEPLLHPGAEAIVARIRRVGAMATVITNGYPLTPRRIDALNQAGLDYLQISIDNTIPDDVSRKSLSVLDGRLECLAARATFAVTINTVLAPGLRDPQDALAIARRARALGFNTTVGIAHDAGGRAQPLPRAHLEAYEEVRRGETAVFAFSHFGRFQRNLALGGFNSWHCGAGARYLYVCEDGLVHYCSQQRGRPGIPLAEYSVEDIEREWRTPKGCAPRCSVSCVHQVAFLDEVRDRPREMLRELVATRQAIDPSFRPPWPLKAVAWLFLESAHAEAFGRVAARLLGAGVPNRGAGRPATRRTRPAPDLRTGGMSVGSD